MTMAIKLFDTMGGITIVTPPSMINPEKISFAIINLKEETQNEFATQLNKVFPEDNLTVYPWHPDDSGGDRWLRQALSKARFIIVDNKDIPVWVQELLEVFKDKVHTVIDKASIEEEFQKIKNDNFTK